MDQLNEALSKDPIAYDELYSIAEEQGFTIQDKTEEISEDTEQLLNMCVLVKDDESYAIEFWEYSIDGLASTSYADIKSELDSRYEQLDTKSTIKVSGTNYARVAYKSSNNFSVVSYIDNTLIYVDIFNSEPDSLKEFLKSIGY